MAKSMDRGKKETKKPKSEKPKGSGSAYKQAQGTGTIGGNQHVGGKKK